MIGLAGRLAPLAERAKARRVRSLSAPTPLPTSSRYHRRRLLEASFQKKRAHFSARRSRAFGLSLHYRNVLATQVRFHQIIDSFFRVLLLAFSTSLFLLKNLYLVRQVALRLYLYAYAVG